MASKIDPFAHLLGKVTDEQIATLAGVALSTVTAYRRRLGVAVPQASADVELAPDGVPEEAVTCDVEPVIEDVEPAPSCVRARASRWLPRWLNGRPWRVGRRDVYTGDEAAWLWEHHRDLVEIFPPTKG